MGLTLQPELEGLLVNFAEESGESVDTVLETAVRQYIQQNTRTQDNKLSKEVKAYIKMHPTLWKQYPNAYVAVHEGQLVDADKNKGELRKRIRAKYGKLEVLIRRVEQEPDKVILFRGHRLVRKL